MAGAGSGRHTGGEDGFVQALGGLSVGAEPPMRDLVPGAIVQGAGIRRRRRIGRALGAAALVALVAGGATALPALTGSDHAAVPAAPVSSSSAVWYPSAKLLSSIAPEDFGTIEAATPAHPLVPGRYFRVTTSEGEEDLYVAVSRTVTDPSPSTPVPDGAGACTDDDGVLIASPWNSLIRNCDGIGVRTSSGGILRQFTVGEDPPSTPSASYAPSAGDGAGAVYLSPDGWTVQVIQGRLGTAGASTPTMDPESDDVSALAADPRLLSAAKKNTH